MSPPDLPGILRKALPDRSPEELKRLFLTQACGSLPDYSSLSHHQVREVKTAQAGGFILCHAQEKGVPVVAVIGRTERGPDGKGCLGVPGGYLHLGGNDTPGEQPAEGALRELAEEILDDRGEPLIRPARERLRLVVCGVDYRSPALPAIYIGYSLRLEPEELQALKHHAARMESDSSYCIRVQQASEGEVVSFRMAPLSEILAEGRGRFTHSHEYDALEQLAAQPEE